MSDDLSQSGASKQIRAADRVLTETEMDSQLRNLIEQLAQAAPADDISDADIQAEIDDVRQNC